MTKNVFIGSALPDLKIGYPPEMSFHEFDTLLQENLKPKDLQNLTVLRRYYDLENIRAFFKEEPLDHLGAFDENELEDALVTGEGFPDYVFEFLEAHEKIEDRIAHFPEIIATFYREEARGTAGFIQKYLKFEREWRLIFAAFRAKKLQRDLLQILQYEDPSDDLVALLLAQKDSNTIEVPEEYEELKHIFLENYANPYDLYKALAEYRFKKVESLWGVDVFSTDRIYAYFIQLALVEKWQSLDKQKGIQTVDAIVKDVS
ncbi:MAG: hypothetical protein CK425_12565 [Parachlamydia sp.]|nr:MAG: hypothetical protein CK425_12565 [Parachlamydia sp.]